MEFFKKKWILLKHAFIFWLFFYLCSHTKQWINSMTNSSELQNFNKLFTDYKERFISFAGFYVRDEAVAEDFVIEALMYYWEKRNELDPDSNIPAYILTVIKHKCLNYLQHLDIRQQTNEIMKEHALWELSTRISTLEACDPNELFSHEIQEIVDKTLNTLPAQTREVFILSRYKNKSHKEIAELLNITTKGVEYHITKALKKLQINLSDYLPLGFGFLFFEY